MNIRGGAMSKILTTQLSGLLQKIQQSEEIAIEETARLLAQAGIGEGNIYFACFGEMQAIEINALQSVEPFTKCQPWSIHTILSEADRVCIFTRSATNEDALILARELSARFIPFAVVASETINEDDELSNLAYTYISTKIRGGILPNDVGERIVIPHTLAALFVYEAIKLNYDEMLLLDDEI